VNFRWTPLAAAQRIRNLIFAGVRAEAVGNFKIKNGWKTPKTAKGGQCRWKRTRNPSCCPLWDLTDRNNTTTGQIPRIVEVLEEIHYRISVGGNMGRRSISDELSNEDSTSTSYLAAKAEMEDASATVGRRKYGTAGGPITSHYWPAFSDSELDYRWRGKDSEASVGREGSLKLLIYINKNIRWTIPLFLFLFPCAPADSSFLIAPIELFSVWKQGQLLDSKTIAGEIWKLRSHYKE